VRIVIVSGDERFRCEMRALLWGSADVWLAGEASDALGAAVVCALSGPDVVIVDGLLPSAEVAEIVRRIDASRRAIDQRGLY
jgi:DNA-binding NarL/FixJ family response regulator